MRKQCDVAQGNECVKDYSARRQWEIAGGDGMGSDYWGRWQEEMVTGEGTRDGGARQKGDDVCRW